MNRFIKYVAAAIIIITFIISVIVAWKVLDNIHFSVREDLQKSFAESLKQYGKR